MAKNGKTKKRYHKPPKPQHHPTPSAAEKDKTITVKTLPADLVLQILYRTQVKALVRCKCVSKSWYALINHPTFIQKHLEFNTPRNTLLICNFGCDSKLAKHSLFSDYSRRLIGLVSVTGPPIPLLQVDRHFTNRPNYPKKINFHDFSKRMVISGSINGIVCLAHYHEMSGRFVALWNPSTHYWNPIALKNWDTMSVGFGFDGLQSDYKVICIVPETRLENLGWSRVEIYSTNRGSWENVEGKDIIPFWPNSAMQHCYFVVKGVPYWIGNDVEARDAYLNILGRIDPVTGLYKKLMYPSHLEKKGRGWVNPLKWKDSVAVVVLFPGGDPNQMVDLYVLLDEDTSNWTKMYSLVPPSLISDFEGTRVPQCFSTGEIVFTMWTQHSDIVQILDHCICDPETGRVFRNNEIKALNPIWHESYSHVESLVCVKGMIQIGKEHKVKKSSPKMKNWTEFLSKEFESVLHL
ncbi:putative F-box protein At4g38870 isoform X1 [Daucus carota subsp. sativus]|uniref:putative F-box protein At4g38870 isoform X1 n=1 Tax=Daucus carota subsp. sativus TaxID=79200 RepID=UPI0007EF0EEA|nr:PREDICTED: putative F-box protein At4g38870 [Daucus carota subsp. sativus]